MQELIAAVQLAVGQLTTSSSWLLLAGVIAAAGVIGKALKPVSNLVMWLVIGPLVDRVLGQLCKASSIFCDALMSKCHRTSCACATWLRYS